MYRFDIFYDLCSLLILDMFVSILRDNKRTVVLLPTSKLVEKETGFAVVSEI